MKSQSRAARRGGIKTGRYFGTDGFRGKAGQTLTADGAYKIGRFLGGYYSRGCGKKCRAVIGKDTRRSSYMLESSLVSGLTASGADAYIMHVTTTPSVSYITRTDGFDCGIMISASHNPFEDNGIKLMGSGGEKLEEGVIARLENYLDGAEEQFPAAYGADIGSSFDYVCGRNRYIGHLIALSACSFKGIKVGLDCANGSAWQIAKSVFDALGARTYVTGCSPDGTNINDGGSTRPERLCALVKENGLDCGFAFDGDADRCIAADECGNVVDGDGILYILARRLKELGELNDRGIVATVMTNSGLCDSLARMGVACVRTEVGDRFVYKKMCEIGAVLGGEKSGHVIMAKYGASGDGLVTAIKVLEAAAERGVPLSSLLRGYRPMPQAELSVRAADRYAPFKGDALPAFAEEARRRCGCERVSVRPSGTEPAIRIMAEGEDEQDCRRCIAEIVRYLSDMQGVIG